MSRAFVGEFLLPLVRGGKLHVGRPIGKRELGALEERWQGQSETTGVGVALASTEESAAVELGWRRAVRARALLPGAATPPLDASTLRLGVGLHNLLCLLHPELDADRRDSARHQIVEVTNGILDLGPPGTAAEAVNRQTLLARVPEIVQSEHVLDLWFGRRRYLGRTPPSRLLDGWRRAEQETVDRVWLREVGVPTVARPLWLTLHRANPLAEALEPLRLDPPLAWERLLTALRFPPLARAAAGRALEMGASATGNALAGALFRFAASRRSGRASEGRAGAAFAVRFVSHLFWLHHLFQGGADEAVAGWDFPAVVVAAAEVAPELARPPDMAPHQELTRRVGERLAALRAELRARAPERWSAAVELCRFAAGALLPRALPAAAARDP